MMADNEDAYLMDETFFDKERFAPTKPKKEEKEEKDEERSSRGRRGRSCHAPAAPVARDVGVRTLRCTNNDDDNEDGGTKASTEKGTKKKTARDDRHLHRRKREYRYPILTMVSVRVYVSIYICIEM